MEKTELLTKWIVLRIDGKVKVTLRENFETMYLADAYGEYGQRVGHYNAGDYCFVNSACDAIKDCNNALVAAGLLCNADEIVWEMNGKAFVEDFYGNNEDCDKDAIENFAEKWREENESFFECVAWNFHD